MLLIKNGYIKPMTGADIPCGCVLIGDDGKILSVAADIAAPEGAQVIDAQGRLVTPAVWTPTATSVWTTRVWAGKAGTIMRSSIR